MLVEDKVTETADLREDLKLDLLDAVELSMMMEEAHGVSIPEEIPRVQDYCRCL